MIVVENITTRQQDFLTGHSNTISCLDVARSGNLIASGQVTFMGFKVLHNVLLFYVAFHVFQLTVYASVINAHSKANAVASARRQIN